MPTEFFQHPMDILLSRSLGSLTVHIHIGTTPLFDGVLSFWLQVRRNKPFSYRCPSPTPQDLF